jgi:hypothetical protein
MMGGQITVGAVCRRLTCLGVWLGTLLSQGVDAGAAGAKAPAADSFNSFKIISDRNIFDPNRRPASRTTSVPQPRKPVVEAFALVGTMTYEKGPFAFFDGSSSKYKKVVEPGGKVGDYTVVEIGSGQVILNSDDKKIEMPVGMQMRREDRGQWKLLAGTGGFTAPATPAHTVAREFPSREMSPSSKSDLRDRIMAAIAARTGEGQDGSSGDDLSDLGEMGPKLMKKLEMLQEGGMKPDKGIKELKDGNGGERSVMKKYEKRSRRTQ